MTNKIEVPEAQDAVYENTDIPKYFFIKSGWYSLSTNGDYIYKLDENKKLELDENGDPIGYIEKLRVRP